jgi:hypothetical protein
MKIINIIKKNSYIFDYIIYNQLLNLTQYPTKHRLIECLEILRNIKYKIKYTQQNIINNIIKLLHVEINNYIYNDNEIYSEYYWNKKNILESIITMQLLISSKYLQCILVDLPLLQLALNIYCNINKKFDYILQKCPLIKNDFIESNIINIIKFLLSLTNHNNRDLSICIILIIYDFLFKNFSIIDTNSNLRLIIYKKLIQFINEDIGKIICFVEKYNFESDIITIWKNELEKRYVL